MTDAPAPRETDLPATAPSGLISICVVFSASPRNVVEQILQLPTGATVETALQLCGLLSKVACAGEEPVTVGIWGKPTRLDVQLQPNDRIEIYRPLKVDPKVARRERFQQQGIKKSGLFAKRRPGAKPGH